MTQDVHNPYDVLLQILGGGVPGVNPLTGSNFHTPATGALPVALGANVAANSLPVVLATDAPVQTTDALLTPSAQGIYTSADALAHPLAAIATPRMIILYAPTTNLQPVYWGSDIVAVGGSTPMLPGGSLQVRALPSLLFLITAGFATDSVLYNLLTEA